MIFTVLMAIHGMRPYLCHIHIVLIAVMEWAPWQDGTWSAESKYDGTLLRGFLVVGAYAGEVTLTPGQIIA